MERYDSDMMLVGKINVPNCSLENKKKMVALYKGYPIEVKLLKHIVWLCFCVLIMWCQGSFSMVSLKRRFSREHFTLMFKILRVKNGIRLKDPHQTTFVCMSLVTVIASGNMSSNFIMYLLHLFDEAICFSTWARFKRQWDKINRQARSNTG